MTDARFPERWLNDRRLLRLDAVQHRAFTQALLWSVSNRTDGVILPDDLELIPRFAGSGTVQELVDAGLWTPLAQGWRIADFAATQTSRHDLEVLENVRRREREKKARQRSGEKDDTPAPGDSGPVPGDNPGGTVPGDSPPGTSPGTTQERIGEARQARKIEQEDDDLIDDPSSSSWPDVTPLASSSSVADTADGEVLCLGCGKPLAPYYLAVGRSPDAWSRTRARRGRHDEHRRPA